MTRRKVSEPIVRPLGLITQPNRFGQFPPGALQTASGVVIRDPGLIAPAPSFVSYKASVYASAPSAALHLAWPGSKGVVFYTSTSIGGQNWFDGTNTFGNWPLQPQWYYNPIGPNVTFSATGVISSAIVRSRLLTNTNQGLILNDNLAPTSNAEAYPRRASLGYPWLQYYTTSTTDAGTIPANGVVAWRCCIKRTFSDGYVLRSAPSSPIGYKNISGVTADATLRCYFYSAPVVAGDVIELYRTRVADNSTNVTNPGATFYKSAEYTITSADIAATYALIPDRTVDSGLADELYTNPGQQGAAGAKIGPGKFASVVSFKGYAFGFNRTDTPSITLSMQQGIGQLNASSAFYRQKALGARTITGTTTIGSPNVTGVSAADLAVLDVGMQYPLHTQFAGPITSITAIGAGQFTVNQNATANFTGAMTWADVLDWDGNSRPFQTWQEFLLFPPNIGDAVYGGDIALLNASAFTPTSGDTYLTGTSVTLTRAFPISSSFTIRATHGSNYIPTLPSMSSTPLPVSETNAANGFSWSEQQQPESWPAPNTGVIGNGTIYGAWATRDAIFVFASDGLYRITGNGGTVAAGYDWRVDPVDSTLSLSAPHAACVLRDTVYAYTNRGLVAISADGIKELSQGRINDLLPGPPYSATTSIQIAADETNDEIWLGIITGGVMTYYVLNTLTDVFTTCVGFSSADKLIAYSRTLQSVLSVDLTNAYAPGTASFQACVLDYQPVTFDEDPTSLKQFQEVEYVFRAANKPSTLQPRWDAATTGSVINLTSVSQDARARAGVPRANAIANYLQTGFVVGSQSTQWQFNGLSIRGARVTAGGKKR